MQRSSPGRPPADRDALAFDGAALAQLPAATMIAAGSLPG
jgi:hypothetical protein